MSLLGGVLISAEWMLMGTKPVYNSGMEQEEFKAYATDSFQELLDTSPIVDTVILYNFDLSESKEIQCVIQNNIADTHLKTMGRQLLCPIGTLKAGMYIYYHNNYWLITGRPDNNKIYEKSTLSLCQYKLRWQNAKGEIIDRWCNATSSSKYGNGESGNNIIVLTDDSLTLLLPNDDESLLLGDRSEVNQRRIFIDKKQFPTKVYKITREDDILYDYGESGGIISFIAKKTELNTEVDNQELRICNYILPTPPPQPEDPDETATLFSTISGNKTLKVGFPRTYSVIFMDKNGIELSDVDFTWNIASSFNDKIISATDGNSITLQIDNEDYIGEQIALQIIVNNIVNSEAAVTVAGQY